MEPEEEAVKLTDVKNDSLLTEDKKGDKDKMKPNETEEKKAEDVKKDEKEGEKKPNKKKAEVEKGPLRGEKKRTHN
jgi:hypothetical protein